MGESLELAPLSHLRSAALDPLLGEATLAWRERLSWDYRASADLVRHYVDVQILNGFALLGEGEPVGYSYYVIDDRKGLIGDLYVQQAWRTAAAEHRLLEAVVDALVGSPLVRRIESQLMMFSSSRAAGLPFAHFSRAFPRNFMVIDLAGAARLPAGAAARRCLTENWAERFRDEAARLIAAAYEGHIDAQINDQYNSAAGARRFLHNIVEYPGCGTFFQPASFLAFERDAGPACGLSLASLVAPDVGHITQVCVHPRVRSTGVGYELLRRSLVALAAQGCRQVSLTVTASNTGAVQLYERMGFHTAHRFDALVWAGF
ncbi:MAG: GNAT family N-acetyltransferase [Acidobacteria bacterium]|nr:GNAT family N-acetyltransferase [Acidobacteriota bacterium]